MIRFLIFVGMLLIPVSASADNLYRPGNWAALAADRHAAAVGDSLVVLVYENASAINSAGTSSKRLNGLSGGINAGSQLNTSGSLNLSGSYDGRGQTSRSGQMTAQLSVVVDRLLENGDLHIAGMQTIIISGERSHIKLEGRVRTADIGADNSILSSRLADAVIEYDGKGYSSRSAKPGIVTRIFNLLGLV